MKYQHDDGGRSTSRRPKQKQDCVVRAIAIVCGPAATYDWSYDFLADAGRKSGRSTPKKIWQMLLNNWSAFDKQSFPAVKGFPRMTLELFALENQIGRFIVQCAGHITTVIDGVVHDDFEPRHDACVYAVWKLAAYPSSRR
jgi:hypothetical protein